MKAYISGPLQAAPDLQAARTFYETLADVCIRTGIEAYLPHQQTDPVTHRHVTPVDVFDRDYGALREADLIIAVIGTASSGVGAELGMAYELGIPVIALFAQHEQPSRFLLGMLQRSSQATVLSYRSLEECMRQVEALLADRYTFVLSPQHL